MLNDDKNQVVQNCFENLGLFSATDYSQWKATRKLKQPQCISPQIRKENGSWARSPMKKANTFATHLSKVFTPNLREVSDKEEGEVLKKFERETRI